MPLLVTSADTWTPPPALVTAAKKREAEAQRRRAMEEEEAAERLVCVSTPARKAEMNSKATAVVLAPDERFVFAGCEDGSIRQWLSPSLEAVPSAPPPPGEDEHEYRFQAHTGAVIAMCCAPPPPGERNGASGIRIFSGGKDDAVVVWTLEVDPRHKGTRFEKTPVLRKLAVMEGHAADVCALVATQDGSHLYSGSEDSTVIEWDVAKAKLNRQFHLPKRKNVNNYCHSLQVSRDEESLWCGTKSGSLLHIRLDDGEIIERIRSCKTDVRCVLLSRDGSELWYSGDTTVRHLRRDDDDDDDVPADAAALAARDTTTTAESGRYVRRRSLLGHTANVCSLACSLDERFLYSGDVAGIIFAHDVESGKVLRTFRCAAAGANVASRVPALAFRSSGELYSVGGGAVDLGNAAPMLRAWKVPPASRAAVAEARARVGNDDALPAVVIETDIGHDCDDLVALLAALSDHKRGRISIKYIATVSQNNLERAQLVQWLCWRMGVEKVPIIASRREEAATKDGKPLDNSVPLWAYVLDRGEDAYVRQRGVPPVPEGATPCPLVPGDSIKARREILYETDDVSVLVIGPGIEAPAFDGLERRIKRVVWQGYRSDRLSFNVGSDFAAYQKLSEWAAKAGVQEVFIGKATAYETRLTRSQFEQLRDVAASRGLDLQMLLQLGVMEFRDAARNLFNVLNFGIATPSHTVPLNLKHMAREYKAETDKELRDVLTMDSPCRGWFDALKTLTPMYDLTAYLLMRDLEEGEEEGVLEHPLYRLTASEDGRVWSVGKDQKDAGLVQGKEAYLSVIAGEVEEALDGLVRLSAPGEAGSREELERLEAKALSGQLLLDDELERLRELRDGADGEIARLEAKAKAGIVLDDDELERLREAR